MTEPISPDRGDSTRKHVVLAAALKREPGSRPEAVRRAKRLLADPSYPTPAMLRSMAEFFVDRLAL